MTKTWAIARHMIAEGIHMKIALVFLGLIGMVVLGLPFSISDDSSLTGAVQSFMSYGLSATGVLLGMLTIFMSRSLADDLVQRQILLVMTKPIARWQYLLGKWLGITILNAAFLACSGLTIYGMVHYIKHTHPPIDERYDKAELRDEVLVARHAQPCKLPDFKRPAEMEFDRNLEEGFYANVPDLDPKREKARLAKKYEAHWRVVGPLETRVLEFENVLVDRSRDQQVQLRYKTEVSQFAPDEILRAMWRFGDPLKGTPVYDRPVRHVVGRYHTIRVPVDAVAEDHTLTAFFYNRNPFQGEPQYRNVMEFRKSGEVELLFVVGSFEGNFLRLLILMMCKLMFLAAVALLMTTVFSFPVACLASFTFYILAAAQPFLVEAIDLGIDDYSWFGRLHIEAQLKTILGALLSDLSRFDAVEPFVNGRNVSLAWVLLAIAELAIVRSWAMLGFAMLLFHRREVAEVSV